MMSFCFDSKWVRCHHFSESSVNLQEILREQLLLYWWASKTLQISRITRPLKTLRLRLRVRLRLKIAAKIAPTVTTFQAL